MNNIIITRKRRLQNTDMLDFRDFIIPEGTVIDIKQLVKTPECNDYLICSMRGSGQLISLSMREFNSLYPQNCDLVVSIGNGQEELPTSITILHYQERRDRDDCGYKKIEAYKRFDELYTGEISFEDCKAGGLWPRAEHLDNLQNYTVKTSFE